MVVFLHKSKYIQYYILYTTSFSYHWLLSSINHPWFFHLFLLLSHLPSSLTIFFFSHLLQYFSSHHCLPSETVEVPKSWQKIENMCLKSKYQTCTTISDILRCDNFLCLALGTLSHIQIPPSSICILYAISFLKYVEVL